MNNPGTEETRSYRNIFKATTLFGGVQVYQILISIIRSKFVAVLLGTAGMGIQGLLQSSISMVQNFTSLGLAASAVRDVSEANGSGDINRIARTVTALRRLTWLTGLLGMAGVIILSPVLSKTSFGNSDYILPLMLLSCIPLIDQIGAANAVILQGMHRLQDLAKASTIGITLSLIVCIPLYYIWGIKGIVPALILTSLVSFVLKAYFANKISLPHSVLSSKETWHYGKMMLKMGLALSIIGTVSAASSYLTRSYIMQQNGASAVGLYQAGFAIMGTYVAMVFNAIGTDFYPRLAAVNTDDSACRSVINQQGEIATQILGPVLCICALTMPIIIRILYSDKFLDASPYVLWSCPGMMLKLVSWLVAYLFVAKAESLIFMGTEFFAGVIIVVTNVLGYKYGGLTGLGIAFSITYLLYMLFVYIIAARKYRFRFSSEFLRTYGLQVVLVLAATFSIIFIESPLKYVLCSLITIVSCVYAIVDLNKKIGLVRTIKSSFSKNQLS